MQTNRTNFNIPPSKTNEDFILYYLPDPYNYCDYIMKKFPIFVCRFVKKRFNTNNNYLTQSENIINRK